MPPLKKNAHHTSPSKAESLSNDLGTQGKAAVFVSHSAIDPKTGAFPEDSEEMVAKEEIADAVLRPRRNPKIRQSLEPFSAVPPDAQHYDTFGIHEFGEWPKLRWMVEDLFHIGSLVMVWGPSGAGKTAWLIDLMLAIAYGKEWSGRTVTNVGVLYCALEGAQGFRNRVLAAVHHHQVKPDYRLRFMFDPIDLADPKSLDRLAATAGRFASQLIIIDTLAAALAGKVDESSNQHMAEVIDNAKRLSLMTGATVLLTHHTGHDERHERGATALRGGVDTSISINRRKNGRYWRLEKQRDGDEGFGGWFDVEGAEVPDEADLQAAIVRHGQTFASDQAPSKKRQGRSGDAKQGERAAHSLVAKSSVKTPTKLQQQIYAALEQLWDSRTQGRTEQEIANVSLSMTEAQKACKHLSRYHTRDVTRAIEHYQASGLLERQEGNRIRLLRSG